MEYWSSAQTNLLACPKSPYVFFCKIKDTFFIFTNNFIDFDILSMSAISRYWLPVGRGQGCCETSSSAWDGPTAGELFGQNVNSAEKLRKPLLTHSISHNTSSIHRTNLFLCLSCIFTFLEIIKHNTLNMLPTLSLLPKRLHKNSPVLLFSFNACWYDSCQNTV